MTDRSAIASDLERFETRGWVIVPASDPPALEELRNHVAELVAEILGSDPGAHRPLDELLGDVGAGDHASSVRHELTRRLVQQCRVGRLVFDAFAGHLRAILGPDVLSQRVPNLVLQPPGDPRPTELHRDAPANSPYEVVAWVPFVDCRATKSMYILDREGTRALLRQHSDYPGDHDAVDQLLRDRAELVDVRYGEALLFWSGLLHGSWVNREDGARLSMNTRFKSLFAPLGLKDPLRYFEVLETSPLTRLGLTYELDELAGGARDG